MRRIQLRNEVRLGIWIWSGRVKVGLVAAMADVGGDRVKPGAAPLAV
jgi:hypothetical protein